MSEYNFFESLTIDSKRSIFFSRRHFCKVAKVKEVFLHIVLSTKTCTRLGYTYNAEVQKSSEGLHFQVQFRPVMF